MNDVYIMMTVAQVKRTRQNYIQFARWLISSLLKTGFPESRLVVMCNSEEIANKVRSGYKDILTHVVPFSTSRMGWFFKPIAYSTAVPEPISPNATMVMSDVDMLFYKNPQSFFLHQKSSVWTLRRERYLRSSRKSKMKKNHITPRLNNFEELAGYMGRTKAYLFIKHKMTQLPKVGLYSDLVSLRPEVYSKTIKLWREMYDDVMKTKYFQGDQQMLDAAVRCLGLKCEHGGVDFVGEFNCGKQHKIRGEAARLGLDN